MKYGKIKLLYKWRPTVLWIATVSRKYKNSFCKVVENFCFWEILKHFRFFTKRARISVLKEYSWSYRFLFHGKKIYIFLQNCFEFFYWVECTRLVHFLWLVNNENSKEIEVDLPSSPTPNAVHLLSMVI